MNDPLSIFAVFLAGLASSVVGTMVGGGGLLSIPVLIFLGVPPQVAIATDRFAGLGAATTALYRYAGAGKVVWRHVPILCLLSVIGALIGSTILIRVDPEILKPAIPFLLVALLPVLFLKRDVGVAAHEVTQRQLILGFLLYFLVQTLSGFFHAGMGSVIFFILMAFVGMTVVEAAASQMLPFIVLATASSLLFAWNGLIDFRVGLVLMAGATVGGYLGPRFALRHGERWVRRLFVVMVIASAALLLLR
jgi:hypothetical protein